MHVLEELMDAITCTFKNEGVLTACRIEITMNLIEVHRGI